MQKHTHSNSFHLVEQEHGRQDQACHDRLSEASLKEHQGTGPLLTKLLPPSQRFERLSRTRAQAGFTAIRAKSTSTVQPAVTFRRTERIQKRRIDSNLNRIALYLYLFIPIYRSFYILSKRQRRDSLSSWPRAFAAAPRHEVSGYPDVGREPAMF